MIREIRCVIAVPDLGASARFYREVLGFDIHEVGDPGWRFYVRDGFCIMAGECPDAVPPGRLGDHSYYAYVVIDDINAFYGQVRTRGAEVLKEIRSEPWGMREFAIRTIDGHRMMFGREERGTGG